MPRRLLLGLALATLAGGSACAHTPCPAQEPCVRPEPSGWRPRVSPRFGSVVKVVGLVRLQEGDPRAKADDPTWSVQIESVGGAPVSPPVELELAPGWSAPADAMPAAPGRYVLLGYETLQAGGQPEGLSSHPELRDFPMSTDVRYRVTHLFAVLKSVPAVP